jgi:hypothetical protein
MIKDILLVTLGVIGGSIGTMWFIKSEIKKLTKQLTIPRKNNDILFESLEEANKVFESLHKIVDDYGYASVADLYDLLGESTDFADNKTGWTSLEGTRITSLYGKHMLKMPRAIVLN